MKKINLLIISIISFVICGMNVNALNNYEITVPSSATIGKSYDVKVSYKGTDVAGSFQMQFSIVNAECKVSSTHSSGVTNCNGGVCHSTYSSTDGIKSGTTLLTMSCVSNTNSTATFKASTIGSDAWDYEGLKKITISSGSKSLTISGTTTKSTTKTTKSTAPYRTTTSSSTKKASTTSKSTSKSSTKSTSTSKPTSSNSGGQEVNPTSTNTTLKIDITNDSIGEDQNEKNTENKTINIDSIPEAIRLKDLKIVGYDIKFSPNKINYSIEVDEDVKEIYIIAEKSSDDILVDNVGVVNIADQKELMIRVSSSTSDDYIEYKIKISIKKQEGISLKVFLITIGSILLIGIIIIVLKEIMNVKKKSNNLKISNNNVEFIESPVGENVVSNEIMDDDIEIFEAYANPEQPVITPIESNIPQQGNLTNQVSDLEKKQIDEASEAWLEEKTIPINTDLVNNTSETTDSPVIGINQAFSSVDDYSDKQ